MPLYDHSCSCGCIAKLILAQMKFLNAQSVARRWKGKPIAKFLSIWIERRRRVFLITS